jgi:hypothetical protein
MHRTLDVQTRRAGDAAVTVASSETFMNVISLDTTSWAWVSVSDDTSFDNRGESALVWPLNRSTLAEDWRFFGGSRTSRFSGRSVLDLRPLRDPRPCRVPGVVTEAAMPGERAVARVLGVVSDDESESVAAAPRPRGVDAPGELSRGSRESCAQDCLGRKTWTARPRIFPSARKRGEAPALHRPRRR